MADDIKPKTLSEKQREFAYMVCQLIQWAYSKGYGLTFGDAYRDEEAQRRMVDKGLSRTMKSKHLERLAIDLNLFIQGKYTSNPDDYNPLGQYWESIGGVYGGRWKFRDANHFEYKS